MEIRREQKKQEGGNSCETYYVVPQVLSVLLKLMFALLGFITFFFFFFFILVKKTGKRNDMKSVYVDFQSTKRNSAVFYAKHSRDNIFLKLSLVLIANKTCEQKKVQTIVFKTYHIHELTSVF